MDAGTRTLKDATSEAIRDWVTNVETTHYILGSAAGPHPYPMMVRPSTAAFQTLYESCASDDMMSEPLIPNLLLRPVHNAGNQSRSAAHNIRMVLFGRLHPATSPIFASI